MELYHGGYKDIKEFSSDYAGETTNDNPHGAFYFTNQREVAVDYSVQSFNRRYQDNIIGLIEDKVIKTLPNHYYDAYDLVNELAYKNLHVVKARITFNNPFIINAEFKTLRELELCFNVQDAIGFIKSNPIDSIPEQIIDLSPYNEELNEYGDLPNLDGLIIKNVIDNIGDRSCIYQDVHIAVYPQQINILK